MLGPELPVAARTASSGIKILSKLWAALARRRQEADFANVFRYALGIGQTESYNYRVAMNHPLYQTGTPHPDDLDALTSILGADMQARSQAVSWVNTGEIVGSLSDGFCLIGSPEAEAITRLAFGYERTPNGMKYLGVGVRLPFRWEEDGSLNGRPITSTFPARAW